MKSIALVISGKAYLPEVQAYKKYFENKYEVSIVNSTDNLSQFDILWYFMGSKGKRYRNNQYVVHEYASLSKPPFSKVKNWIKKITINKPNLRIFLNDKVRSEMNFLDNIPYTERDMGVSSVFMSQKKINTETFKWDFIYVGSMDKSRQIHVAIDKVLEFYPKSRIVLVGDAPTSLIKRYQNYNVDFIGKIDYEAVPDIIKKARIALNYIPDVYPYNVQTSTKFLEYLACGSLILTNRYNWVDNYCKDNNVSVLFFDDISNLYNNINNSQDELYKNEVQIQSWEQIIHSSNIEEYLP